jgi:hypothetical protein
MKGTSTDKRIAAMAGKTKSENTAREFISFFFSLVIGIPAD